MKPNAPTRWFELLFEGDSDAGPGLPTSLRAVYGGDWRLPQGDPPYVYVNFCTARDGRVSFAEPGHASGGEVSGFNGPDRWLMGLLRARADAVMVGDGTLAAEPEHVWTAEFICPSDAEVFAEVRGAEGRRPLPLMVFVSFAGDLPWDATVFGEAGTDVVVATTARGARAVELAGPSVAARLDVLPLGDDEVDLHRLAAALSERYGVERLLCEGGPRLYGSMLRAHLPCDEFVTLSPLVVGDDLATEPRRPSLVEGARFQPGAAPRSRLLSVRRAGDHLFLRSRYD